MNVRDLVPWGHKSEQSPSALQTRPAEPSLFSLHREMDRLFDDMLRGFSAPSLLNRRGGWPQLEVEETESEYRIHADLPGLDDKDVEVFMQDGVLTIRGEKRVETEDRHRAFSERFYGRFERRLALENRMQARFHKGVLTVTAPKSEESRERIKRIPINAPTAQARPLEAGPLLAEALWRSRRPRPGSCPPQGDGIVPGRRYRNMCAT